MIDARLTAGEALAAISADTGLSRTSLHRHRHNCGTRHLVPSPIADGEIMLPVPTGPEPAPSTPADGRAIALQAFFDAARQHARTAADRQAVAAHLLDLAALRAATAADHREIAQTHALLAVSKQFERQAGAQRAAEAAQADPHASAVTPEAQRIQAMLAGFLARDPAEKRWALDHAGFDAADAAAIMGRRPRMRIVASSL